MNKKFSLLVAVAAIACVGAGCLTVEERPVPSPQANEPAPAPEPSSPLGSATEPEALSSGVLHVEWSAPAAAAPIDVFTDAYEGKTANDAWAQQFYEDQQNYHVVGTVKDGPYADGAVMIVLASPSGPGVPDTYRFVVPKAGKPVLLATASAAPDYGVNPDFVTRFDPEKFAIDTTATLPELKLPETISYSGATLVLSRHSLFGSSDFQIGAPLFDPTDKVAAFTDPQVGTVYVDAKGAKMPQNGFYAVAPDGTVRDYAVEIPFYDKEKNMPHVTWNDGTANATEYWGYDVGGCGAQNFASIVPGVTKADLVAAGKTEQGDPVYRFKNPDHAYLKDLYQNSYMLGREAGQEGVLSLADFVKADPIFLWFDPLGRLIKFQQVRYLPGVECGKPVIYLYPPKTENVSVKLSPEGGFTKSEPSYNEGWNVLATPEGALTDLNDGKAYPYLFWEGRGGLYQTPKQGWSVAQKDVHGFLTEKLSALGLNAKESADFIEFWEPRMQGSPYYFVTFLGNQAMDALAPMNVTPKPDSVIRILMDFSPLSAPADVQGFDIRTPKRDGFTVVEWGGVLR